MVQPPPMVTALLAKAERLSQADKDTWKIGAGSMIASGEYEELSETGFQQAVDNLAYRLADQAVQAMITGMSPEEEKALQESMMDKMADLLITIAIASKTHYDIVNARVGLRTHEYVVEMIGKVTGVDI